MTRLQLGVCGLLMAGAALLLSSQHRSHNALRGQNESLRRELAQLSSENERLANRVALLKAAPSPSLEAPVMTIPAAAELAPAPSATNLVALLLQGGEAPKLAAAQLNHYLEENHRSAASLLAAYRTSGVPALLREAMEKYPGDPRVAFEAAMNKDASVADRRQWLDAFKQAAPGNPMANYLSALDYFKSGQTDQAVQELQAASRKSGLSDYTVERIQADEEAYRAAGFSDGDAKMAATWGVGLPQLAPLKAVAQNIVDLAGAYRFAGDTASADAALQIAISLGQQMDASTGTCVPLVTRLVGITIERMAFGATDPAGAYGDGTVQQQLDRLAQRRTSIRDLAQQVKPFLPQMSAIDWQNYNQRTLIFGEENAMGWLLAKYSPR